MLLFGVVKMPKLRDHWSGHYAYQNPFIARILPRRRFDVIMKYAHFQGKGARECYET